MELEPQEKILQLKSKIQNLNKIIEEAKECEAFKAHGFYPILQRTLLALKENYEKDAFKAARDSRADISNYLGRMEMIVDFYDILDKFALNADQAQLEIDSAEEEIKQLNEIMKDDAKSGQTLDIGGNMG